MPALADHVRDRTCEQAHENQAKELRTRELREERREQIGSASRHNTAQKSLNANATARSGCKKSRRFIRLSREGKALPLFSKTTHDLPTPNGASCVVY